jgi:hypothetical protein
MPLKADRPLRFLSALVFGEADRGKMRLQCRILRSPNWENSTPNFLGSQAIFMFAWGESRSDARQKCSKHEKD